MSCTDRTSVETVLLSENKSYGEKGFVAFRPKAPELYFMETFEKLKLWICPSCKCPRRGLVHGPCLDSE